MPWFARAELPVLVAVVTAGLATGCSEAPAKPVPAHTYALPAESARPGEKVITPSLAVDGLTRFWLIGFQDGMSSVIGSHAEWNAKGRFASARIVVQNVDRTNQKFEAKRQLLVASDGRVFHVDNSTQAIKRQPDEVMIGSFVRMEFDLWFDVPKDAEIVKLRLFGEPPFGSVTPPKGVDIPVR
ncbi:DUF4352 domain-containing protein [Microtetraspora sp. NBRC 16547]|uniref:DUF4352 domain-containing protein n=1 Tax=Microtetraspora sp. NBRC 16547 TaxID=3030993 RepID=UPI0024A11CCC|nr:DUF4352 domain-containing protein [Microtetraspora sp. NBRC 16547]GLW97388.1 hypothetical protein Misp02_14750 [Microtetraspora sp. NBRC 16547]